jgi:cell division protease FtsH
MKFLLYFVFFPLLKSNSLKFKFVRQEHISIKTLIDGLEHNEFDKIYFSPDMRNVRATSPDFDDVIFDTNISPSMTDKFVDISLKHDINPIFEKNDPGFFSMIPSFFYILMIYSLFRYIGMLRSFINPSNNNNNNMNPFSNSNPSFKTDKDTNVTLTDWAGSQEVLAECTEFITYLKNNSFYDQLGASMPKGILLDGPPGTGKTLLAKAIAGETNSSFISASGSEFIEMFVGVGALRVRKLFEEARQKSPTIIFIDEIDAIGKKRGRNIMTGNDESEQTLNQLLTEMDGFRKNENITIIAATNRVDILDEALLRPGRFDRIIKIPLPDYASRIAILKLYLQNKNVDPSVSIENLAKVTPGYSGAELKNLVNEACIKAARQQQLIINQEMFDDAFDTIMIGVKKVVDTRDNETKRRISIHEIGHAFIVNYYNEYFDLQRISIQPSYSNVGGFTLFTEKEDIAENRLYTKDLFIKRLMIMLGGKAAETVFYGENLVSLGASMDLKQANELANEMVEKYGMGNLIKVFSKSDTYGKTYSAETYSIIDEEALGLINYAYDRVINIMKINKKCLENVVDILSDKLVINGAEFSDLLIKNKCIFDNDDGVKTTDLSECGCGL